LHFLPKNPDGTKTKLKEYLASDEMTALLAKGDALGLPLKLVLVKAGHDRRYTVVYDLPSPT
jgi:hypothetical protein